jgi:hypothetical protein
MYISIMAHSAKIIDRFGGIRPMARELGVWPSVVQGWKERGIIPPRRHSQILNAAQNAGIAIDPIDLINTSDSEKGAA